jgi:anti-sigma-K factor RskA
MSGSMGSPCGTDVAPYVLGALEPDEAHAFVRHLGQCAMCRDEVAALGRVLEALPPAAPRRVRPALRRRVLRAARDEPKTTRPDLQRRRRPILFSAPAGWLALGLAILAALAVGLGSSHATGRVIEATVGRAELRVSGGHGRLLVSHLAPLPANRVYEVWLQPAGRPPLPRVLFAVGSRSRADIAVPGDLHGTARLLVTIEPRGGSRHPTTRPVIQLPFADVSRS